MSRRRMSGPTHTSRASVWEWTQALLLAANLGWTTLCLGGYLAETMVVTSALTGALVAVHLGAVSVGGANTRIHPAGWVMAPFLVYAAANVIWVTPVHWLGWRDWFGWAQMLAVFWVVLNGVRSRGPRRALFATLAAVSVVAVLLGVYQRFGQPDWLPLGRTQADQFLGRASGCFGIPNSLAALLLLVLPPAGVLVFQGELRPIHRLAAGGLALVLAFGLVLTISRGAWISVALVLVTWPLVAASGNAWRRLMKAAVTLVALLVVVGGVYAVSPLVRERLTALVRETGELSRPILWRVGWQLFREHPVVGTGAGSYNVFFEQHRPEGFAIEPQWAHNDYLNTLSDYGSVGFLLFFGTWGVIAWRCARGARSPTKTTDDPMESRAFAGALVAGMAAFALQLFVDFHFKIPALAMAFAIVGAIVVQQFWPVLEAPRPLGWSPERVFAIAGLVGCAAAVVFFVVPHFRAEALRYRAHRAIDQVALHQPDTAGYRSALPGVRADLGHAVTIDPTNAQAWADIAFALSLVPHAEPQRAGDRAWLDGLGREAEIAANRALALTSVVGEFWIRRGVARDMQAGRWLEGGNDFTHATSLTPTKSLAWYYYAFHLSLNPNERGMADAMLDFCLRLDPANPEGLALRQHLAISRKAP